MKKHTLALVLIASLALVSACKKEKKPDEEAAAATATASASPVAEKTAVAVAQPVNAAPPVTEQQAVAVVPPDESFTGKWNGPGDTFIMLIPLKDAYMIDNRTPGGMISREGKKTADGIEFERDGKQLVIRKGTGKDTGVKALADKNNCLVIDKGEGYCKD